MLDLIRKEKEWLSERALKGMMMENPLGQKHADNCLALVAMLNAIEELIRVTAPLEEQYRSQCYVKDYARHTPMQVSRKDLNNVRRARAILLGDEQMPMRRSRDHLITALVKARNGFESILCLAVEGPEFYKKSELCDCIAKEASKYYDIVKEALCTDSPERKSLEKS